MSVGFSNKYKYFNKLQRFDTTPMYLHEVCVLSTLAYSIYRIITFLLVLYLVASPLFAFEIIESQDSVEDLNLKTVKLLNKLTEDKIEPVEKTRGFNYRYSPVWYSPFKYDVYVGKFLKKSQSSLLRIEAPRKGEEKFLKLLIRDELGLSYDENKEILPPIKKKSHLISQTLNLVAPYIAIPYNSYKSPLYSSGDTWGKAGIYFLIDAVIIGLFAIYAENTTKTKSVGDRLLLKEGPNTLDLLRGEYSGLVFSFLAVPRLIRAFDIYNEVASQNRYYEFINNKPAVEISYTIRY